MIVIIAPDSGSRSICDRPKHIWRKIMTVNQIIQRFVEWDMYESKVGLISTLKPVERIPCMCIQKLYSMPLDLLQAILQYSHTFQVNIWQ
jgi:hypothetical protein